EGLQDAPAKATLSHITLQSRNGRPPYWIITNTLSLFSSFYNSSPWPGLPTRPPPLRLYVPEGSPWKTALPSSRQNSAYWFIHFVFHDLDAHPTHTDKMQGNFHGP